MRRWENWPGRFGKQANSASGVLGLAGGGVTAFGLIFAAPVIAVAGAALVVGVFGWCAVTAIPPKQRAPQDAVGDLITDLAMLGQFAPPPKRVGFLGASRVGKSTLLMHLVAQPAPLNMRTDDPYAVVTMLPGKQPLYFALIDGAGQQYSQQFRVADESDCLIMCLDHTSDDRDTTVDLDRLRQHDEFLKQLLGHLKTIGKTPSIMHFLLNKRDIWEQSTDRTDLERWFNDQVALWSSLPGVKVTSSYHSNFMAHDTTSFIGRLRGFLQ